MQCAAKIHDFSIIKKKQSKALATDAYSRLNVEDETEGEETR